MHKFDCIKYVEIDEEQAEIVRFVFKEYARGVSKDKIAQALNARGFRLNGKTVKGRSFDRWLLNEKYTGEFHFGERLCNNMYPQIINRATFDRAQALLKKNKYFAKSNAIREPFLLNSKLYCGHCDTGMIADGGTSHTGATYKYYVCKTARKRDCEKTREDKNELEEFVAVETIEFFKDPKQLNKAVDDTLAYHERKTGEAEIKSIEAKIAYTKKDIEDTTTAYIKAVSINNDLLAKGCEKRAQELNILVEDLETQKAKLVKERGMLITRERILACIAEYTDGDPKDKAFQKRLIDNLVNCVYITNPPKTEHDNGGAIIFWNVLGTGKQVLLPKNAVDQAIKDLENKEKEPLNREGSGSVAVGGAVVIAFEHS